MFRRVQARRYKLLKYVDVRLEPMNILVGPNASGKSTLLDVFGFLQTALTDDVEKAVRDRATTLSELVWMGQDVQQGFELAVEMDIPKHLKGSKRYHTARYELNVGLDEDGSLAILAENLFLITLGSGETLGQTEPSQQQSVFPDAQVDQGRVVTPPQGRRPRNYDKPVSRGNVNSNFRAEAGNWNTAYKLPKLRLSLSGIPDDENRFPISLWFRQTLLDSVQILQLNSVLMRRPTPSDAQRRFQIDGSNLPLVVDDLKRNHPQRFEWWIEHLQTILPDLQGIDVGERPENRSRYLQAIYSSDLRVPAWLLSDGTLRLLALTLIAYLPPDEMNIFMVEEPENGVHPAAIQGIFSSLSSLYDGQVFLATHSPLLLGLAELDHLLIFAKTGAGESAIVRGGQHPMLKEWQRDLSLGTLLAAGVLG